MSEQQSNSIDTWAIVEIMGHQQCAGRARTEAFGGVVMLRVDTPELPERKRTRQRWNYERRANEEYEEVAPLEPSYTQWIGMGSIYRLTPCTEQMAVEFVDRHRRQPIQELNVRAAVAGALPDQSENAIGDDAVVDDFEDDDDDFDGPPSE